MVVKLWQLRSLKQMQSMATAENKADVGNVIKLYQDRTIGKYTTALKLASQLAELAEGGKERPGPAIRERAGDWEAEAAGRLFHQRSGQDYVEILQDHQQGHHGIQ